ncbi:MAG TPA: hypothetical protein VF993_08210 [Myxococcales bacterium]
MRRFAIAVLLCTGCSGLIGFDVDSSGQSTIQGSPTGALLPPAFQGWSSMSFSQSAVFQNNNTNKDHISACRLTRLTVKVVSPTGGTLAFLTKIDFFIEAPNLQKIHIAGLNPVPGTTSADLQLDDVDIAAYAKSDTFSITTTASGQTPAQTTTIEADLKLHVNASLL